MALVDDGMAMEVPVELLMIQHRSVAVEAALPEPGEFRVEQTNPQARVEVKNVRAEGKIGRAEVVAKFEIMDSNRARQIAEEDAKRMWNRTHKEVHDETAKFSLAQFSQELTALKIQPPPGQPQETEEQKRKRYEDALTIRRLADSLRPELQKIAGERPAWLPPQKQLQWTRDDRAVLDSYSSIAQWYVIDRYLTGIGLGFATNTADYQTRLKDRIDAAHRILSGKLGEGAMKVAQKERDKDSFRLERQGVEEALGAEGLRRIREMVEVRLRCHFLTKADPQDVNSQWFNGQRIACQAPGVALIRVVGRLDPGQHDRVDWWILEGHTPGMAIQVDKPNEVALDQPFPGPDGARLRVAARGDKPVEYALEFRGPGGSSANREVVIYESPSAADAAFPF